MSDSINPDIFKAYDIRGIYPTELDEDLAEKIAQAFAVMLKQETGEDKLSIVVSRDMRLSSPQIHEKVIQGLISQGVDVIDVGLASTPTYYFSVGYLEAHGGIQISASHNPSEYNGLKLVRAKAVPVSGESGMYDLRDMVLKQEFDPAEEIGSAITREDILTQLISEQTKDIQLDQIKPFKVVVDPANAMGALYTKALFDQLPCELIEINFKLDGTFPSHEADPLKDENLVQCKEKVIETGADLGIALDGDGDRVFIIMNDGERLSPEILRGILAQRVLQEHPGASIGYDIRPGKITEDMIVEAGGKPFITRVGHSLIKERMIAENSPFSGESSGHFFYKTEYGSYETPVLMISEFLLWLSQQQGNLSEIAKLMDKYFHSGEINSVVEDKEKTFQALKDTFSDASKFSDLDGVYFEYDDYWFNVRASNTEPKMRLNLEARSKEVMEEKRDQVLKIIRDEKP